MPWTRRDAHPFKKGRICRYGEGQNRTGDTTIFSRVLYQLSYLAGQRLDGIYRLVLAADNRISRR